MTKQEFAEMQDLLYYGHDVELKISNQHYFIEWNYAGIDVFFMSDGGGKKIMTICGKEKSSIITHLLDLKIDGRKSLNDFYCEIEIVDIE